MQGKRTKTKKRSKKKTRKKIKRKTIKIPKTARTIRKEVKTIVGYSDDLLK